MGFFRKSMEDEEDSYEETPEQTEEKYEKLFPKIGRDFLYREDFVAIMDALFDHLEAEGINRPEIDVEMNTLAINKAVEYKDVIQSGDNGNKIYDDLIDMDS